MLSAVSMCVLRFLENKCVKRLLKNDFKNEILYEEEEYFVKVGEENI